MVATRDHEQTVAEAERIYAELRERGVDVVLDDREESAGVKFEDADLIGYPVQVVVGKRGVEAGTVDLKLRATGERTQAPIADAASRRDRPAGRRPVGSSSCAHRRSRTTWSSS